MPVAMRPEVYVGGLPITGMACSNPAEDSGLFLEFVVCCVGSGSVTGSSLV